MNQLNHITLTNFISEKGKENQHIQLSYEIFGEELHSAPFVLLNHALKGTTNVAGDNGGSDDLVGVNKTIN